MFVKWILSKIIKKWTKIIKKIKNITRLLRERSVALTAPTKWTPCCWPRIFLNTTPCNLERWRPRGRYSGRRSLIAGWDKPEALAWLIEIGDTPNTWRPGQWSLHVERVNRQPTSSYNYFKEKHSRKMSKNFQRGKNF